MSRENNRCELIGLLGKDVAVKHTPSGTTVANFSMATDESYKDNEGEWQKKTTWHNIVAWKEVAEYSGDILKKGDLALVIGKLQTRSYDKDGETKYVTEVVANFVQKMVKREKRDAEASSKTKTAAAAPPEEEQSIDEMFG